MLYPMVINIKKWDVAFKSFKSMKGNAHLESEKAYFVFKIIYKHTLASIKFSALMMKLFYSRLQNSSLENVRKSSASEFKHKLNRMIS